MTSITELPVGIDSIVFQLTLSKICVVKLRRLTVWPWSSSAYTNTSACLALAFVKQLPMPATTNTFTLPFCTKLQPTVNTSLQTPSDSVTLNDPCCMFHNMLFHHVTHWYAKLHCHTYTITCCFSQLYFSLCFCSCQAHLPVHRHTTLHTHATAA